MRKALPRLASILLLLAGIAWLQRLRVAPGQSVLFAGGALLLAGLLAGKVARACGLPKLTGYLLVGVAIGPYALSFLPQQGVAGLDLTKGVAVSLIAFAAGTELELAFVRRLGARVLVVALGILSTVFVLIFGAVVLATPFLPFVAGFSLTQRLAVAGLLASTLASFSPTVTIAIVQETGARGRFTEFLMAVVILGDLVVMLAFAFSVALMRASLGGGVDWSVVGRDVGWELAGSLIVGLAVGGITAWYLRRGRGNAPLFIGVACFVSAELGMRLGLSPLLLSLAAGAVMANAAQARLPVLHEALESASLPVLALFFAAAGAGLELDVLKSVGLFAVLFVVLRAGAIIGSSQLVAPRDRPELRRLWMGLISQAGVTFGLAALIGRSFPSFGPAVQTLIVAIVTLHELVGPLLTRRALAASGEIPTELAETR